ncbi:hypothetical protein Psyc_1023 [Psychrobacter arcticus 273-4]|uniref:Uncharacterized protein n=1 Tax=Psychrobacter arcticus (strain DSM 17307 / VKM B-2377 / 273-4) TaxID=259536 RepID=Q4FSY2_PSYA2|nr:hypothetical protein [Psychrobacter arcticus]AAZ18876.1 hypothetical protein Psyc_1023 [Psychrobacter arcticus 273-4]
MSGNLWMLFKGITEQSAQQIATVLARNGNSYDVQVLGGGISVATSSVAYVVGDKVFVRDGQIVSQAPNLTYVEIDI